MKLGSVEFRVALARLRIRYFPLPTLLQLSQLTTTQERNNHDETFTQSYACMRYGHW